MKTTIINTALDMVNENGIINLSRSELCERVGIPDGSFNYHIGSTFTEFIVTIRQQIDDDKLHVSSKSRVDPALRKEHILNAAISAAKSSSYLQIGRDEVAEVAGVSASLVSHYFNTMQQLRRDVMRAAVRREILEIIVQGLVNKDRHAQKASKELRVKALAHISGE